MKKPLTDQQKQVFQYISRYQRTHQCSPPLSKIAERFGWNNKNSARFHVLKLVEHGKLKKTPRGYVPA